MSESIYHQNSQVWKPVVVTGELVISVGGEEVDRKRTSTGGKK